MTERVFYTEKQIRSGVPQLHAYEVEQAVLILHGECKGMFKVTLSGKWQPVTTILLTGEQFDERVSVVVDNAADVV